MTDKAFHELSFYTLAHPDTAYFIHQHIVDAFMAQRAEITTPPIGITFSLVGLYLYIQKNYSGRQVQQAHIQLAKHKKPWPAFKLPAQRGEVTISDVLSTAPGEERDAKIKEWCVSVWEAYQDCHEKIKALVQRELKVEP